MGDERGAEIEAVRSMLTIMQSQFERGRTPECRSPTQDDARKMLVGLDRVRRVPSPSSRAYSGGHLEAKARGEHRGHHGNPCWCVVDRILAAPGPSSIVVQRLERIKLELVGTTAKGGDAECLIDSLIAELTPSSVNVMSDDLHSDRSNDTD
jgi:hypothetical protein